MTYRQLIVLAVTVLLCGWMIVRHPPGYYTVEIESNRTPLPTGVSASPKETVLRFVGDIMLSRSVGDAMRSRDDWVWPFARIASITSAADLTFGNLETTVSSRGFANGCGFCFRADPRGMEGLRAAGFDVLSVANNHVWDFGLPAFEDTLRYISESDMMAVGGGMTIEEARKPHVRVVNGSRIAFLAYTDILPASAQATDVRAGAMVYRAASASEDIVRSRTVADIVVVSFHTGTEYELHHSAHQERIYHELIDAGADVIIGHHPHVVQDVEQYRGKWIIYSLGNFVFDQNWSEETRRGMMLDVHLRDGAISSIATHSIDISTQYQPTVRELTEVK